jgi:hypothetical protein
MTPPSSIRLAISKRQRIWRRVGGRPGLGAGAIFMPEREASGAPQPTQAVARSLIERPHSLQGIIVIGLAAVSHYARRASSHDPAEPG